LPEVAFLNGGVPPGASSRCPSHITIACTLIRYRRLTNVTK
jgi:hypothetical protein